MPSEKQPHATCGAKGRKGPCQSRPVKGSKRCRMHGGKGSGAPAGNGNSRTHGLFARSLGELGKSIYEQTGTLPNETLARDTARFVVAKVAEAYGSEQEHHGVFRLIEDYLDQLVDSERISRKAADFALRRLSEPSLDSLGRALGPLKGLLDGAKQDGGGEDGDGTPSRLVIEDPGDG